MSCLMLTTQAHATIANSMEHILNLGYNRFGFEAPESLRNALEKCRDKYGFYCSGYIFKQLYTLNTKAYCGRYHTPEYIRVPDMPDVPALIEDRKYENRHETLLPWHYKFCKLLDCLIYQCSEDATKNDPLLLSLIDFSRVYKSFLVQNTEEWQSAPWGTI